jgi:hypothetical protein
MISRFNTTMPRSIAFNGGVKRTYILESKPGGKPWDSTQVEQSKDSLSAEKCVSTIQDITGNINSLWELPHHGLYEAHKFDYPSSSSYHLQFTKEGIDYGIKYDTGVKTDLYPGSGYLQISILNPETPIEEIAIRAEDQKEKEALEGLIKVMDEACVDRNREREEEMKL